MAIMINNNIKPIGFKLIVGHFVRKSKPFLEPDKTET